MIGSVISVKERPKCGAAKPWTVAEPPIPYKTAKSQINQAAAVVDSQAAACSDDEEVGACQKYSESAGRVRAASRSTWSNNCDEMVHKE